MAMFPERLKNLHVLPSIGQAWRKARGLRSPTAFVLSGGGTRGAAQVGMLMELASKGIVADFVLGASIGAVNAVGYAGNPTLEGIGQLAENWVYACQVPVFPTGLLGGRWRFFRHGEAAFSVDGLRMVISRGLRFENLEDAKIPVGVVATALRTGEERWFTSGPALDAVLASAALPGVFPPVVIGGEPYIDGGVVNDVPLMRAVELGAKEIFVLLCGPLDAPLPELDRPLDTALAAFGIAVHARFRRELKQIPRDVQLTIIELPDPGPLALWDLSRTKELIEAGRQSAANALGPSAGRSWPHSSSGGSKRPSASGLGNSGALAPGP